ncbi:P-loop NTPase fold protein [Rhodovulum sp. PH10]|uniref:P-loop NTPase fold protein n=1 Tax=Rhodovulum sp. PH10 TaxID=1187851 RepID=UPI0012F7BCFB|nr:P-loop NTPase fold protein [Rhodovulum sp. PH10]
MLRYFVKTALEALEFDSSKNGRSGRPGGSFTGPPKNGNDIDRPQRVFCIDGGRGSGKTFTLLSAEHALHQLSKARMSAADDVWIEEFKAQLEDSFRSLMSACGSATLAHVLRIIFPGDMEGGESLMESIFAAMTDEIEKAIERGRKTELAAETNETLERLKTRLREEVAEGWYFAKRFGHEAIIRDSIDYRDYVTNYEKETRKAATRIDAWRRFVNDYLDVNRAVMLVVLVDDTDVHPELTQDILHAIRMFLNHPRIFTVLAGNLKSMRMSLLYLAMSRLAPSIAAFRGAEMHTPDEWRQVERRAIEDYLEKVIPPSQRFFLRQPSSGNTDDGRGVTESDFHKIARDELLSICDAKMREAREHFLQAKFSVAISVELGEPEAATDLHRGKMEKYLSWWVFANRYSRPLAPRSARQIKTFYDYFGNDALPSKKRLEVVLHGASDNYMLIQRMGDQDVRVSAWLRQQSLGSEWSGQRAFLINTRRVYQGTYTYDFLRYRLDAGLAMPLRENAEEAVPLDLLPRLYGRRFMRRFFHPRVMPRQHRRFGVARLIDHAALPGNFADFYDLGTLPDISIALPRKDDSMSSRERGDAMRNGKWEASLYGRWVELLDEGQYEPLVKYFTEIVCSRLRWTDEITSATLMQELVPPKMDEVKDLFVDADKRRWQYERYIDSEVESFDARNSPASTDEAEESAPGEPALGSGNSGPSANGKSGATDFSWGPKTWAEARRRLLMSGELENSGQETPPANANGENANGKGEERQAPDEDTVNRAKRLLALYSALVTDLRRAWHAIRLHEHAPRLPGFGQLADALEHNDRTWRSVIDNQQRMVLYTREQVEEILTKSPWTKLLLAAFGSENLNPDGLNLGAPPEGLIPALQKSDKAVFWIRRLPRRYSIASEDKEKRKDYKKIRKNELKDWQKAERSNTADEAQDFKDWIDAIRCYGRSICAGWPVYDDGSDFTKGLALENELTARLKDAIARFKEHLGRGQTDEEPRANFQRFVVLRRVRGLQEADVADWQIDVSTPIDLLGSKKQQEGMPDQEKAEQESNPRQIAKRRTNAREARNFLWLMFGLAPNLPAIIHTQLMAYIYEGDAQYKVTKLEGNEHDGTRTEAARGALTAYLTVLTELHRWVLLVGTLSVSVRYVRLKCMHLFAKHFIDAMLQDVPNRNVPSSPNDPKTDELRFLEDYDDARQAFLAHCDVTVSPMDSTKTTIDEKAKAKATVEALRGVFGPTIPKHLGIMPDMSPTSLFGDHWMRDLVNTRGVRDELCQMLGQRDGEKLKVSETPERRTAVDDPAAPKGMLFEIETWLWATNRCLRKWYQTTAYRRIDERIDDLLLSKSQEQLKDDRKIEELITILDILEPKKKEP